VKNIDGHGDSFKSERWHHELLERMADPRVVEGEGQLRVNMVLKSGVP
jgi:hypothetical protein